MNIGVQSYCFREFRDNQTVAEKVRDIGLSEIELCGLHADFDSPESFAQVVDTYRSNGNSIVSFGVQMFVGDAREKNWFECAKLAGASHISCHFSVDSFTRAVPKVRKWSRDYDIKVGMHCHGGYMFGGQRDVISHILALGGPEIGLCIDTAWALQTGPAFGNPVEWARAYAGSVYGVHYKDFVFQPNGRLIDAIIGEGSLDLPAFLEALRETGFNGVSILEYEGDAANPVPALKTCAESIKRYL